jgi:subfamily B ATP-binding cassette protein HlyB/CyaB
MGVEFQFRREEVVWLLGSLSQIQRIPFDPALILQQFPPPYTLVTLIEAARALGFRTGESATPCGAAFAKLRFPCVAFLRAEAVPAADTGDQESPQKRPALLIKADAERLLYFVAGEQVPRTVAVAAAQSLFEPELLLLAHEAKPEALSPDDPAASAARFGFRWFAAELFRHKKVWREVLSVSLFIQLIALTTPLFTQVVIDKVVVHQTNSTLVVIASGLAMFMLFSAAMSWLRQYLVLHTGNRVDAVLGSQVFRHLLRLPMTYFEQRPTGTLVARLHAVETIREFMAGAAVSLVLDFPFLLIFLAVMFAYSWQLSLIAVGCLSLIAVASLLVTPLFRARLNQQFLLGARNQSFLTEYVVGMETVKSLQMEPRLEARYDDYLASYLAAGFSTRQISNTYNVVANGVEQGMTLAILCVGALLVMQNDGFTIGMLVAFQMFASRLSQPMLRLAGLWQEFQQANIAVKRLGDIMDAPAEPYALTPSRTAEGIAEIRLNDLSFRYSPEHPYLYRNLNVILKPGKLTVLSGPSGCGKSTLAKLLLGFYQPSDGQISIDGRDIRNFSANELRQYYGVVPQETYLFSGSIYENLIAASPHAGFNQIVEACKIAEIHDVIEKLPNGYNTPIGEHGAGLSGGQKQRIAIARALLKRPKILIFDEATSSLDQATAELFARTINQLKGKVTMLFITHALPKGLKVDDVVMLGPNETQMGVISGDKT